MTWQSIHLFLADPANTDSFLQEVIGPTLAGLGVRGPMESWFFIRYWEGGPHLRLRVKGLSPAAYEQLMTSLRTRFGNYLGSEKDLPGAYPDDLVFERPDVDAEARRWLPQGTIKEIAYQPERARYGGPHALDISERLFAHSSDLALQVIGATAAGAARQTTGLLLTCVALAAATRDRDGLLAFLRRMKQTWQPILGNVLGLDAHAGRVALPLRRRYLDLICHLQAGGEAPQGHAGNWWTPLQEAMNDWRRLAASGLLICPRTGEPVTDQPGLECAIAALIDSHIHMMNNRLGLTPPIEYWYASMLAQALSSAEAGRPEVQARDPALDIMRA
jgi:thiopeptide-type bacteriocin biosynthesis protein